VVKKPRLLIIDDSKEVVAGLEAFFEQKYEVITASNGLKGLIAFEENETSIDLVISDLIMPIMSGVELLSIIRSKHPEIPLIAITGYKNNGVTSGVELYADKILEKPFDILELEKSVEMLLSTHSLSSSLDPSDR